MMDASGGTIVWNLDVNTSRFTSKLKSSSAQAKKFGSDLEKAGARGTGAFSSYLNSLGATAVLWSKKMAKAGIVAAAGFSVFGLKTAGDLEAARQGFITLLGSAKEADNVISQIKRDAARTPFELTGLIKANQALTSVTKNGTRSEKILLNVGKALAAAGRGQEELDRVIFNLQQIGNTANITELDVRQFGYAGVNILELLADHYGVTKDKAGEMVKDSKDAFGDLEKAFERAGDKGGRFEKAFENQAGTFNQLVSNMKDSFTIFASDFVKKIGVFDFSKRSITALTDTIKGNNKAFNDLAIKVSGYLQPKLKALWETFTKDILPSIKELAPLIGVGLVGAIGLVTDGLNLLFTILGPVFRFLAENKGVVVVLTGAFIALKTAIFLQGAAAAFAGVMGAIRTQSMLTAGSQGIGGMTKSLKGFGALTKIGYTITVSTIAGQIAINLLMKKVTQVNNMIQKMYDDAEARVHQTRAAITSTLAAAKKVPNQANKTALSAALREAYMAEFSSGRKRASGGPVRGSTTYLVGEEGPELFTPSSSGNIIPNDKLGSGSGGSKISITLHMDGIMARSRSDLRDIAKDMLEAVNEQLRAKNVPVIGGGNL